MPPSPPAHIGESVPVSQPCMTIRAVDNVQAKSTILMHDTIVVARCFHI